MRKGRENPLCTIFRCQFCLPSGAQNAWSLFCYPVPFAVYPGSHADYVHCILHNDQAQLTLCNILRKLNGGLNTELPVEGVPISETSLPCAFCQTTLPPEGSQTTNNSFESTTATSP